MVIPRAVAFVRSIRSRSTDRIRPAPRKVQICLNVLYAFIAVLLVQSLPYFAPPNIYLDANSRLGTSPNLLWHRLSAARGGNLTGLDQALKTRFDSEPPDIKYVYAAFGPQAVAYCPFCKATEPNTYLYYALPAILGAHVLHTILLGAVTSAPISGPDGARWRTYATMTSVGLAAAELYMQFTYKWRANATVRALADVDFFFWRMRTYRLVSFALVDALLGWTIWLTSTRRFVPETPAAERLAGAATALRVLAQEVAFLGAVRNTVMRDEVLRKASEEYWAAEPRIMEEVEGEREVVDAKRLALSRMDYGTVQLRVSAWTEHVWGLVRGTEPLERPRGREKMD